MFRPDWGEGDRPCHRLSVHAPRGRSGAHRADGSRALVVIWRRARRASRRALAALIADPGELSLFEEMKRRLPPFAVRRLMDREGLVPRVLEFVLSRRLRHVSQGWALRRGLLVHGLKTPIDYLRLTADYATERPEAIRRPTLICSAENDATRRDRARPLRPARLQQDLSGLQGIRGCRRALRIRRARLVQPMRPRLARRDACRCRLERPRSASAEYYWKTYDDQMFRSTCMLSIPKPRVTIRVSTGGQQTVADETKQIKRGRQSALPFQPPRPSQ